MNGDDRPIADFGIAASIDGSLTLLALRGEVDCATAPDFRAFFDAMIDIGRHSVVLDLAKE
jgi:anti-anti-sigma regulatory factor